MATAEQIIVAVSKHDEGAARAMLADCAEQKLVEGSELYMGPVLDAVIAKLDEVRPTLVRSVGKSYVSKGASGPVDTAVLEDLDDLILVCKASQTEHWVDRGGTRHRIMAMRDERGRFAAKPGKGESDPGSWTKTGSGEFNSAPSNVESSLFGEKNEGKRGKFAPDEEPADEREIKEYLGRVQEVRSILQDLQQNVGRNSDLKLKIEFENPEAHPVTFNAGQDLGQVEWDRGQGAPDRYSAVTPKGMEDDKLKGVAQAMGAGDAQGLGMKEVRHYAHELLDQKNLEESGANKAQKLVGAGAQLADLVGMKGLAGALSTGSQALRVSEEMRPTLARAAYRYRGTERVPEKSIVQAAQMEKLIGGEKTFMQALKQAPAHKLSRDTFEAIGNYSDGTRDRDASVVGALAYDRFKQFKEAQFEAPVSNQRLLMAIQRDRVGQELLKRVMQREASGAAQVGDRREGVASMNSLVDQIAAGIGRGLPSEGVLIDDGGEVVAQSVGMGGDNYQPFTAAALGKLNGGQYVRTRNSGGISPDDVRTLLISGGRAGMIVSPAGIFDLEFDPRFRGTKRFSDKALQMIDTYTRILDQLAAKEIYARDLPAEVMAEVTEEAVRMSGVQPGQEGYKVHETRILDAKRLEMSRVPADQQRKFREEAKVIAGDDAEKVEAEFRKMMKVQQDENVRALSLNGEGYAVALRSLQEFYPYWIRSANRREPSALGVGEGFDPKTKLMLDRMESGGDKEYVKPGNVRAGGGKEAATGRPNPYSATVIADEKRAAEKKKSEVDDKKPSSGGTGGTDSTSKKKEGATKESKSSVTVEVSEGPPLAAALSSGGKSALKETYSEVVATANDDLIKKLKGHKNRLADRTRLLKDEIDDGINDNAPPRFERGADANGRSLFAAVSDKTIFADLVKQYKSDPGAYQTMVDQGLSSLSTETKSTAIVVAAERIATVAKSLSILSQGWEKPNDAFSGSPQLFTFLERVDSFGSGGGFTVEDAMDSTEYKTAYGQLDSELFRDEVPISVQADAVKGIGELRDWVKKNADELAKGTESTIALRMKGFSNKEVMRDIVGDGDAAAKAAEVRKLAMKPESLDRIFENARMVYSANHLQSVAEGLGVLQGNPKALAPLGLNKEKSGFGQIQKSMGEDEMVDFSQMSVEEVLEMMDEMKE